MDFNYKVTDYQERKLAIKKYAFDMAVKILESDGEYFIGERVFEKARQIENYINEND